MSLLKRHNGAHKSSAIFDFCMQQSAFWTKVRWTWSQLRNTVVFVEAVACNFLRRMKGRGFVKCRTGTCTLFTSEQKYVNHISTYEMKLTAEVKPNQFPLCICDETASYGWPFLSQPNRYSRFDQHFIIINMALLVRVLLLSLLLYL